MPDASWLAEKPSREAVEAACQKVRRLVDLSQEHPLCTLDMLDAMTDVTVRDLQLLVVAREKNRMSGKPSKKAVEAAWRAGPQLVGDKEVERMLEVAYAIDFSTEQKKEPVRDQVPWVHDCDKCGGLTFVPPDVVREIRGEPYL